MVYGSGFRVLRLSFVLGWVYRIQGPVAEALELIGVRVLIMA